MAPHSCRENPMEGRTWWAAVHGVTKSRARLSDFTFHGRSLVGCSPRGHKESGMTERLHFT